MQSNPFLGVQCLIGESVRDAQSFAYRDDRTFKIGQRCEGGQIARDLRGMRKHVVRQQEDFL